MCRERLPNGRQGWLGPLLPFVKIYHFNREIRSSSLRCYTWFAFAKIDRFLKNPVCSIIADKLVAPFLKRTSPFPCIHFVV
jgi:hypothetical protein